MREELKSKEQEIVEVKMRIEKEEEKVKALKEEVEKYETTGEMQA